MTSPNPAPEPSSLGQIPHRFLPLDGLRGVAALGVVAFHVTVSATQSYQLLASFYLLVDFFFVLSGFVLLPSLPNQPRFGARWGVFALRRVFRLWPLTIAALVMALLLLGWQRQVLLDRGSFDVPYGSLAGLAPGEQAQILLLAFALLQVFSAQAIAINVPLWSLSAEWLANLSAGPFRLMRSWGLTVFIALGYLMLVIGLSTDTAFIDGSGPIRGWEALGRAVLGFGIGLLLRHNLHRLERFRGRTLLALSLLLVALLPVLEADWHWDSYRYQLTYIAAPIFALLILQISRFQVHPGSSWGKTLSFAGAYSFGLYVFHQPLIQAWNVILGTPTAVTLPWSTQWLTFFIVQGVSVTLIALGLTALLRWAWERPIQRFGNRLLKRG